MGVTQCHGYTTPTQGPEVETRSKAESASSKRFKAISQASWVLTFLPHWTQKLEIVGTSLTKMRII